MQKIIPHLWFDTQAEEAANFYISLFNDSKITDVAHYPDAGKEITGKDAGSVMTVAFEISGYSIIALNGGPHFNINPSISFMVNCESKEEVDRLWGGLSNGGTALMPLDAYPFSERYGWIQDRFGMSWQISYSPAASQKIIPALMFVGDNCGKAEEAISLYTSIVDDAKVGTLVKYPAGVEYGKEGTIMFADFILSSQSFAAMDSAGPHQFNFNEGVSLLVNCENQEEIDRYWSALSAYPESEQCGWLKDRYGLSWQISPKGMDYFFKSNDREAVNRAMAAMLSMKKIDIAAMEAAARGA
ncbi:MAG: VOC family protein [Patescibacteria group bacterium]